MKSSLAKYSPVEPMTAIEMDEYARRAWHAHSDMVGLRLSEIKNDWELQTVINILTRQYGKRAKKSGGRNGYR